MSRPRQLRTEGGRRIAGRQRDRREDRFFRLCRRQLAQTVNGQPFGKLRTAHPFYKTPTQNTPGIFHIAIDGLHCRKTARQVLHHHRPSADYAVAVEHIVCQRK